MRERSKRNKMIYIRKEIINMFRRITGMDIDIEFKENRIVILLDDGVRDRYEDILFAEKAIYDKFGDKFIVELKFRDRQMQEV